MIAEEKSFIQIANLLRQAAVYEVNGERNY